MATATETAISLSPLDPMLPLPYWIKRVNQETDDTFTLELIPADSKDGAPFAPGQFNMVYVFGVGEVPISISSDPAKTPAIQHTTRVVGTVTKGMRSAEAQRHDRHSRAVRDTLASRAS
jgi:NAD(P)H-flavin reductase